MKTKLKKIKARIVERGPKSGLAKQLLISVYILALRLFTNYGKLESKIYEVMYENRPELEGNKKASRKLYREIIYCRFMYGIIPKEYFIYGFEYLSHEGKMLYVTRGNKYKYYRKFNNKNYAEFLNKKTETYRKFGKFYGREMNFTQSGEELINRFAECLEGAGTMDKKPKLEGRRMTVIFTPAKG